MAERLKQLFAQYDKADSEHSPYNRAQYADCIVEELRDYVSDERLIELVAADKEGRCLILKHNVGGLWDMYCGLCISEGDDIESYTTGYRAGHRNGQRELLGRILCDNTGDESKTETVSGGTDCEPEAQAALTRKGG